MPKWVLGSIFTAFLAGAVGAAGTAVATLTQLSNERVRREERAAQELARNETVDRQFGDLKEELKGLKGELKSLTADRWTQTQQHAHAERMRAEILQLEARWGRRFDQLESRIAKPR